MIFEGKKKQDLIDYCKKNNIANFSNKSKDELITHITKIEALKKCFRGIRDYGFIQQLELDTERNAIISKNAENVDSNGQKKESLGDELERIQLEQMIAVTKLEKIRSDRNNTFAEPEPESATVTETEPESATATEPDDPVTEPSNPLDSLFIPRATDEELEQFIKQMKAEYPCSNIEFTPHEHIYRDENYRRYKEYVYENTKSLGEHGEKLLMHGTDEKTIKLILDDDFSLTNQSKHGTRLGKGIYFTDSVSLACNYSERGNLKKYIILCKVHVGNIMKGNSSGILNKMPKSDFHYDTIVDNVDNTQQYSKVKNNTYSIQGVITITINDKKSPLMKHYSSMYRSVTRMTNSPASDPLNPPNQAVHSRSGRPKKLTASVKFINHTHKKIDIYFKPKHIGTYEAQLKDLKLMNILMHNNSESSLHTNIGDVFMCSDKTGVIKIVEIQNDREIVTID